MHSKNIKIEIKKQFKTNHPLSKHMRMKDQKQLVRQISESELMIMIFLSL